jgi:hypothetical protein
VIIRKSESQPIESVFLSKPVPDGKFFAKRRGGGPDGGSAIRQAAEAVRDAKEGEEKAAAEKTLDDLLSNYFDEDMARRESELTKIEERLVKLRDLQERRQAKKQEIIELQQKVALNEADGLGFYDGQNQERLGLTVFDKPVGPGIATFIDEVQGPVPVPADAAPPASTPVK